MQYLHSPVAPARVNWIFSQIGARQHFALPRAMQQRGQLRTLYTDAWCRWGWRWLRHGPGPMRSFAGRCHSDLPSNKVVSFTIHAIWDHLRQVVRKRTANKVSLYNEWRRIGSAFATRVNRHLQNQTLAANRDVFCGFTNGCLETLPLLRSQGVTTIVDQIDPARVEEDLVVRELERWPGWQRWVGRAPDSYYERVAHEWDRANLILVNSQWTKKALIQQKVPMQKIIVVPLAFEPSANTPRIVENKNDVLTVIWLGIVSLRKGIPYLMEAAKLLAKARIRFLVAGPLAISTNAIHQFPSNVEFVGTIARDQVWNFFRRGDLFVLPTLSDGFAITQIEAMAHGLPVVATPCCGEVVTDGWDGLIVPPADSQALADAIAQLEADRPLLSEMSQRAVEKSKRFTLGAAATALDAHLRDYWNRRDAAGARTNA